MLELFGDEYIFQHCANEVKKRRERQEVMNYITLGLYCLTNNRCLTAPFEFEPMKKPKEVSADEIISNIKAKFRE